MFLLPRSNLAPFRGEAQLAYEHRSPTDAVQVRFFDSKNDQKRVGCTITRTRPAGTAAGEVGLGVAFEAVLELLDVHPQLAGKATLTARLTPGGNRVFTHTEAV